MQFPFSWRGFRSASSSASSPEATSSASNGGWNSSAASFTASTSFGPTLLIDGSATYTPRPAQSITPSHSHSHSLKQLAVQTALTKLFNQKYFSICELDKIMRFIGGKHEGAAYRTLSLLHCVDYSDIPPELRQQMPNLVNQALLGAQPEPGVVDVAMQGLNL